MKMKRICVWALLLLAILNGSKAMAGDHVTLTMQNPTSTVNTIEYDVYIVNDGTTSLNLGGYQFGVNFATYILNTGTPTSTSYVYLAGTRDPAFASLTNPSVQYNNSQLKVVSTTIPAASAVPLPIGTPMCLGRFQFTNTTSWFPGSDPSLAFQLTSAAGKTLCIASCFIGAAVISTPLTFSATTLNASINFSNFLLNVPLPVSLRSFDGQVCGSSDCLSWITNTEENNRYFNLQYSTDAIHFATIEKVYTKADKGSTGVSYTYQAVNTDPREGHNYYRLEQVDVDGHVTLAGSVLDLYRSGHTQVLIYPNPVNSTLQIQYTHEGNASDARLTLLDMNGRRVVEQDERLQTGSNQFALSMDRLSVGHYLLQITANGTTLYNGLVDKAR